MDIFLSVAIGIGLSAACGFRIFVPPLVMSIAAIYGHLPLSADFQWIGTYPALVAFAFATCIEIAAYYVPWIDNLLDTVSTPGAITVGIFITKALVHDSTDPLLGWTIAVIAGGGSAGIIQTLMGMVRLSSTALTGGIGNAAVSTIEAGISIVLSGMAVFVPILAIVLLIVIVTFLMQKVLQTMNLRSSSKKEERTI
ncbi:MAG: DUF4126 domain-containing protein [Rhizonema sp. NSF051]|nr:DUF4126 domain-containing protein [Rhizonema sp. NSF051]